VRLNPGARRSKPKARLKNYEALLAEGGSDRARNAQIHIPAGPRSASRGGGGRPEQGVRRQAAVRGPVLQPAAGGIVGVIGPNGAGKTTLFRMITGSEQPDGGSLRLGDTVDLAYVDQSREALDADKTVWEEISEGYDQNQGRRARDELARLRRRLQLPRVGPAKA